MIKHYIKNTKTTFVQWNVKVLLGVTIRPIVMHVLQEQKEYD